MPPPEPDTGSSRDAVAELETTDAVFSALAHRVRRRILLVLRFRGGSMTAGEIAGRFACSWPTTSRHLGILRDAGLVTVETRGRERVYRLARAELCREVLGWLRWFDDEPPETP